MTDRSVGPRCGNNPNARRTPGDQKVIDAFQAQLALRQAAKLYIESAVWEDGDPLMEVIAATIWEHCARDDEEMPQLVCDDPRTIAAFAAAVARAHAARVAPATDQAGPSRRAGLRDEIVNALGQIKTVPPVAHRREQADHVLAVLYREWPWLRAEAEETATDQAEALASCPGYETSPNLCRCPCYGCKHHCSAHDPEDVRDAEGATDQAAPDLTAEEARDLADELGTELYRAQDALAFVEECCVIADREGRQPTTADVREWLKGARCGRQLAADARDHAALRDRIAEAVRDAACNGDCGKTEEECAKERIQPVVWHHGRLAAVEGTPEQFAAAVLAVLPTPATDQAADVWVACSPEWLAANPGQCGTAPRIPGPEGISHLHPAAGRSPAAVCICGHTEQQHFEDVCLTEITGCDCGDFLTVEAAAEEITRLRQIARQHEDAVDVDTLARLMCDADVFVNDGDYPGWDDLSTTPGLGKDEVRKAARYLMRRLHITLHKPAAAQQPKEA